MFKRMLAETVAAFETSLLRDVPESAYRDFCEWALSARNPRSLEWMQSLGITQLVHLTSKLFEGLLDEPEWMRLLDYARSMNVYQLYEIVSDNLAIGLARPAPDDAAQQARHRLLRAFNAVTIQRLEGSQEQ